MTKKIEKKGKERGEKKELDRRAGYLRVNGEQRSGDDSGETD